MIEKSLQNLLEVKIEKFQDFSSCEEYTD